MLENQFGKTTIFHMTIPIGRLSLYSYCIKDELYLSYYMNQGPYDIIFTIWFGPYRMDHMDQTDWTILT